MFQNAIKTQIRDKFKNNRKVQPKPHAKKRPHEAEAGPASKKSKVVGLPRYAPSKLATEEEELRMLAMANEMKEKDCDTKMDETFDYRRQQILGKRTVGEMLDMFPQLKNKEQVSPESLTVQNDGTIDQMYCNIFRAQISALALSVPVTSGGVAFYVPPPF